jgi:hypothetical protein
LLKHIKVTSEMKNPYSILVGTPEGKRALRIPEYMG